MRVALTAPAGKKGLDRYCPSIVLLDMISEACLPKAGSTKRVRVDFRGQRMELGYSYIKEYLSERFTVLASSKDRDARYSGPLIYRKDKPIEHRCVYVARFEEADARLLGEDVLAIVCYDPARACFAGQGDGERFSKRSRSLCVEIPESDMERLYECLLDLFHQEDKWRDALWLLHFNKDSSSIKDYLDASINLFEGALTYDPAGEWRESIHSTRGDLKSSLLGGFIDEDGMCSEAIDFSNLEKVIGSHEPAMVKLTDRFGADIDILAISVRGVDGSYLGVLKAPLADSQATQAQLWHISELRDALETFFNATFSTGGSEVVSSHSILRMLLSENIGNARSVKRYLKMYGLPHYGNYICGVIDIGNGDSYKSIPLWRHRATIESADEGCLTVEYDTTILALIDTNRCKLEPEAFFQKVIKYYHIFDMHIGVSFPYCDILLTSKYAQQARAALEMGVEVHPARRVHLFTDVAIFHILRYGTERLPARMLCVPGLVDLQKQSDSGVDYIATLTSYIQNLYNAAVTAKELDIHRSTLQYRLSRISDITRMNLDDPHDRLYLEFSVALLKQH